MRPVTNYGTAERPTWLGLCLPRPVDLTPVLDEVDGESPFGPIDSTDPSTRQLVAPALWRQNSLPTSGVC